MPFSSFPHCSDSQKRGVPQQRIEQHLQAYAFGDRVAAGEASAGLPEIRSALNDWRDLGLVAVDGKDTRLYDPAEVINFMKWSALAVGHPFWRTHCVSLARRKALHLREIEPKAACVSIVRRFDEETAATRRSALVPAVHDWTTSVETLDLQPASGRVGRDRVDWTGHSDELRTIAIAHKLVLRRQTEREQALDARDKELYLGNQGEPTRVTPEIESIARRFREHGNPWRTTQLIVDWFLDSFFVGVISHADWGATSVLGMAFNTRLVDCYLGSCLLVALFRSCRIPARVVGGLFLYPSAPARHFWVEVHIESRGWLCVDPLIWDLSAGGRDPAFRHSLVGESEPRLVLEVLPWRKLGASGGRLPQDWYSLLEVKGGTVVTHYLDATNQREVYSDAVSVRYPELTPGLELGEVMNHSHEFQPKRSGLR